jgi:hypothetical protein
MVLNYKHVQIGGQEPTPPVLTTSLISHSMIRTSDCTLKTSGTQAWRKAFHVHIYKIGGGWFSDMLTAMRNGSFKTITRALRHNNPIIAETAWGNSYVGNHTHYIVITGWMNLPTTTGTWNTVGKNQNKRELEGTVQTTAAKGRAQARYASKYGDFLINDPNKGSSAAGRNIPMFADNASGSTKHPAYFRIRHLFAIG